MVKELQEFPMVSALQLIGSYRKENVKSVVMLNFSTFPGIRDP